MALTVRARGESRWGTLRAPLPLQLDLTRPSPAPLRLAFRLGHKLAPPTTVYAFTAPRAVEVQAWRHGDDPLLAHVSIALQHLDGRRVGPLVLSASGAPLEFQRLEAGTYLLVAALGLPEEVAVELDVTIRPARAYGTGLALLSGEAIGRPAAHVAIGLAEGAGTAEAEAAAHVAIGLSSDELQATVAPTDVRLLPSLARGLSVTTSEATARKAPFRWIDAQGRPALPGDVPDPAMFTVVVQRFSDWAPEIRLKDLSTGEPLSLAGHTVSFEIWDERHYVFYGAATIEALNDPIGHVRGRFPPAVTGALPLDAGVLRCEMSITGPAGEQAYPAAWVLTVSEGVSR